MPDSTDQPRPAAYTVRDGTAADVPKIVALAQRALGGGVLTSEAYWRWKHLASPFGASPVRLAVGPDGQVVGLRTFTRWEWASADATITAVRPVDTATDPGWRRRGIFKTLTLRLVDQATSGGGGFVYNTPNDQSHPGYLKMGWTDVCRVPIRMLPLRPARMAARLVARRLGGSPLEVADFPDDGSV